MCWGMPFSVSPFVNSLFALFSHLGGIPFCQLESRLLPFSFSYFFVLVSRDASCLCYERLLGLLVLVFLCSVSYFFSCPFLSNCLNLLWLCAWKDLRPLMVAKDPGYLVSCRGFLFRLDISSFGLQASWAFFILSWSLCTCFFGLGLFFFWAWLTLLGFSHCDLFRPQHLAPRALGLPETHAWVIQVF